MFSQILKLIPRTDFERMVKQTGAQYRSKGFSSWSQFVGMLFCQLGRAHSLREIEGGLKSCEGKLVHLGIEAPARSSLSYANGHRPWELFEKVFYGLFETVAAKAVGKKKFRFKNKLVSIDSTVIDLCLSMYDWAKFRRTKGAVKLHLVLDHDGYLPCFGIITDGKVADVKAAHQIHFAPETIVVDDRGYNDYRLFAKWTDASVYFVTRMKDNTLFEVVEEHEVPRNRSILKDQTIRLSGTGAQEKCPHLLRRVEAIREDTGGTLVFLTNHHGLGASTIAAIYKDRWQIELFFKAIKQNLKIKTFVGTSANAVKTQIWTALISMLLLRYLQMSSRFGWSLANLVALLRMNLFTHRDLMAWLDQPFATPPDPQDNPQAVLAFA
ncbi:MAG: IS4 family transposase [Sterolibacteriaceae bacterium]|nr:IS4 family transposase [Sterolibacteriaceae bacterium]MBK9086508.1 IS4 family transposase [Sterolibacteriaceae bacterium]MBK9086893.1 IS4 family transposase [Sterolibacteriaceae bacterium]